MGHNVNFCSMCGAPEEVECPRCRRKTRTGLDDYDIDCNYGGQGNDIDTDSNWVLTTSCGTCEYEFQIELKIKSDFKLLG